MSEDPIKAAVNWALGPLFARMSRSQEVAFMVDGQRYDVACAAGDTVRVIEASLRCAVAARKAGGVNNIVFSDWKRDGAWWFRSSADGAVYVTDQAERSVFRVLVCSTLLGSTFACPDAAREAADAYLVSQGRLPAERAFVRLGEWEQVASVGCQWQRAQAGVKDPLKTFALTDDGRESVDAHAVSMGWLDPSRAFKAGPASAPCVMGFTGATGAVGGAYTIPTGYSVGEVASKINADPNAPVTATVKHGAISLEQKAFGPTKPAWGEWERIGIAFVRRPSDRGAVPIAAYVDRWELGGNRQALATDIDDAREKADAWLVARGELEAGRAFERVGDWTFSAGEVQSRHWCADWCAAVVGDSWGVWGSSYLSHGIASGPEDGDAGKAAADAELVRRGLLAEERAFKVARPKLKPLAWDVGGGVTAVTGLAFGNAVPNTAVGIDYASAHGNTTTAVVVNKRADGVSEVVGYAQDITKMPDDEINAMYGKHSEVARAMIGAKRRETRTVVHAVTNHGGAVTLATWEHHLPTLLDNAPREFRDGFNRRQGPAWEAYLRGLAGVREEIQCRKLRGSPGVTEVVLMATTKAHIILGPYWIDANVVGKR